MSLQKRSEYGFNGYQVPPTPRAARSVRKRSLVKRRTDDNQMCAFDLLATVAGKLLLDGESLPSANTSSGKEQPPTLGNSAGKEDKDEHKSLEEKPGDRDCYERNFLFTEIVSEAPNPNSSSNKPACTQNDRISRPASGITSSDCSEKFGSAEHLVNDECKLSLGISTPSVDIESSGLRISANSGSEEESRKDRKDIKLVSANFRNSSLSNKVPLCSSVHPEVPDRKSSALVCSVDSVKFPFCRDRAPCGPLLVNRENVKLVKRDDDDNSSECVEPSTRNKAFKPPGDRRFRKFLAPKHCKITSIVKDDECSNAERHNFLNRKNGLKRQRSLRDYPFKKRKLYDCSSASNSDESITGDGMFGVSENGANEDGHRSGDLPGANAAPTSVAGGYNSFHSTNSQVKLRIKTFRVPELFIEIPETATVGSLKCMVMEAVNAVLGSGLRVGVVLQGKKIRDDSKTLLQTGICHDNKMDTLGFTLEANPAPASIRSYPEDGQGQLPCDNPQPLARYPPAPSITQSAGQLGTHDTHLDLHGSFNNFIESDHDSAPSPPGMSLQRTTSESKALVPVPSAKQDALAVVPLRKSKRSESTQRRIRRPFTVAEVEALVQAVEKLGTGRWRDVKLRAFDNAKHRTYVDLKDKWKTLVHTAGISPQQRRGEPVPQELLDRVLTAHAYWSQQQPKQHQLKSEPDTCLLL
ncbi:telomere repeat-binding protein 1-like [Salvia splendens]|uniref:telomere repeat-binding protein 1-like n=1 Tax=Salvia splendens TaxID=180675 RepID=UPI001C25366C|nr:telomere repeat-binding protein 1-like [Salvia splendens]XP_041991589.1 telomere repeat-binding protein 1-like [Salvia splendens]